MKSNPAIPGAPKQCFCAHLRARLPLPVALEVAFARPRDRARGDHDGRRAASSGDEQQNDRGHGGSQVAAAGRRALVLLGGAVVGSWVWGGRQLWRGQRSR